MKNSIKINFLIIAVLFSLNRAHGNVNKKTEKFGGWSITEELFDYIQTHLPQGSTILELGSGWASGQLSKNYTVYSIENNPYWLNRFKTNYIHAPIVNKWYDVEVIRTSLPDNYDLILVDGPLGRIGREGFIENISLFNTQNKLIIVDDVDRKAEYKLLMDLAQHLNRNTEIYSGGGKQFGVLLPN